MAEAIGFLLVSGVTKALGKLEKLLMLAHFRLDAMACGLFRGTHSTNMHENYAIL
jgi:hypothetical protein